MRGLLQGVLIGTAALVLGACQSSSPSSPGRPTATSSSASLSATTTTVGSTTTTAQTSGTRTVLSPLGLNIRAQATTSATVLGTAAQGTTLTVLAHNDQGGGWFQVKGATVTGWIRDDPALSSSGKFMPYDSSPHQFSALYPDKWTVMDSPPAAVVFHPPSGGDSVMVTTAASVTQLGRGRPGYQQRQSEPVVVCGITADLLTYEQVGGASSTTPPTGGAPPERYLIQVHLTLDPQHALGIDANLADPAQMATVRNFVHSVKFPFPKCES